MSRRVYNAQDLKVMSLFEKIAGTKLKDYFTDENNLMTFVVEDNLVGKAIGKQASNVRKLEDMLKRKIKILGFNQDPKKFLKNLLYPLQVEVEGDDVLIIKAQDSKTKAFAIGRNQSNIKNNLDIMNKYFKEIKEIKVM